MDDSELASALDRSERALQRIERALASRQATRTRELAEREKEKDIKANLLEVAERYDRLAVEEAKRER